VLDERSFLEGLKQYIERVEEEMWDGERSLESLVESGEMPSVYDEVLERLVALRAEDRKCSNCGNPLRDTYSYTTVHGTFRTCPWCQKTWSQLEFDAVLATKGE